MFEVALAPNPGIERSTRIGPLARATDRLAAAELLVLLSAGLLAALAVALISPSLRIPGSAILRAALPIVCGVALVPRRFAGSVATVGAALTVLILAAAGVGSLQPVGVTALLALGPAADATMALRPAAGWRLYLRFGVAGILANSLAFVVRAGTSWLALDAARPHVVANYGPAVYLSFAGCGLAAGLLSAAICFRASARNDNQEAAP